MDKTPAIRLIGLQLNRKIYPILGREKTSHLIDFA